MPANAGWAELWTDFDASQMRVDFSKIVGLGANTIRVGIPPSVFGFPRPNPKMVSELASLVQAADEAHLRVQLTLFDQFGNYDQVSRSESFARELLTPYRASRKIAFVELQNEIQPSNHEAMVWANALMPVLRHALSTIPVTISTPGVLGASGLIELKKALRAPPDFYDAHYYGGYGDAASTFAQEKAVAAPYLLYIGETGLSTYDGPTSSALLESAQAGFLDNAESAVTALGLPPAAVWTYSDFSPQAVPAGSKQADLSFGLFRTDGTAKPAVGALRSFYTTGAVPTVTNPGFETVSDDIPTGWTAANRENGTLSLSSIARSGAESAVISSTSGSTSQQPAWSTVANTGPLHAGDHLRATVWAAGVKATGHTVLTVSWFDSKDTFLCNSTSSALPVGDTAWTKLAVDATVPPAASYARVNLQSYGNSGTAYFDDVTAVI